MITMCNNNDGGQQCGERSVAHLAIMIGDFRQHEIHVCLKHLLAVMMHHGYTAQHAADVATVTLHRMALDALAEERQNDDNEKDRDPHHRRP